MVGSGLNPLMTGFVKVMVELSEAMILTSELQGNRWIEIGTAGRGYI